MNFRLAFDEHAGQRLAEIDAEIVKHMTAVRTLVLERTELTMHQFVNDATRDSA